MKVTKDFSTNKGITLIALVITIIVMLILVGVTISMAVNGGLFDYAGKATGETKNALNAEGQLAEGGIEVDGVWYNSIDEYLNKDKVKTTAIRIDGPSSVAVRKEITLEVYNQANQKVNPEDIEWTITGEFFNDEEAATVNNGVVKGISVMIVGAPVEVKITATYIPDRNVNATKQITVMPILCEECKGVGIIEAGYYECPDCNERFDNVSYSDEEYWYLCCYNCGYENYPTSAQYECPSCGYTDNGEGILFCDGSFDLITFPCDYSAFEYMQNFYVVVSSETCEACNGAGEFFY